MARTEVKLVLETGEVRFYEFASVDLAIVGLGKLAKVKVEAPAVDPRQLPLPLAAKPPVEQTVVAPQRQRKPRSDAGKPRGPYNKGGASETGLTQAEQEKAIRDAAANKADDEARAKLQAERDAAAKNTQQPDAGATSTAGGDGPAAPAAAVSDADLQAKIDKLFAAKGLPTCMDVFARFGVKKGRDIPANLRAEFMAKADRVIAGEAP